MKKIKILIADDHTLVRDGLIAMLKMEADIQIVGEASNGLEVLEKIQTTDVDIILMDIMMDGMNGLDTTKTISEKDDHIEVILLSMEVNEEFISEGIKNGAKAYLPKDISKEKLLDAIRKVHAGDIYFGEKVSQIIFENFYNKSVKKTVSTGPSGEKLSKRETEILQLLAEGKTGQEISDELYISIKTVDTHRYNIMQKLKLKNTAELVKYAIKHGYIEV